MWGFKNKYLKNFICVSLCVLLITSLFTGTVLAVTVNQYNKLKSETKSLEKELTELLTKIDETETQLAEKNQEIEKTEVELKKAEKKEKKQYNAMKKRIKFMYESGNEQLLVVVLQSQDLSDLLSKVEYVSSISSYDRQMLVEFVKTKEQVASIKDNLEAEKTALEKQGKEYEAKQAEVTTLLETKKEELASIDLSKLVSNVASASKSGSSSAKGSSAPVNVDGNSIVSRAYSAIGTMYHYGSTDCSGLVSYALTGSWAHIGSSATFGAMTRVSDPQPGDICCEAGHVGIYIGNGQMIHAPQDGETVCVANVHSGMWYVRY